MMKLLSKISVFLCLAVLVAAPALATNGDNLIGVGPISRAMGGVGIAAPQDAISAVFSNPAAMCFGPFCPTSQVDFAGTLFMPDVKAKVTGAGVGGTNKASSDDETYAIPAFGVTVPIGEGLNPPNWRFGLAAYGVTGLGVDYRESDLDRANPGFGGNPLIAGDFTALQSMRFAPSIAYQPNAKLSFGLAGVVEYSNLDLAEGSDWDYGFGLQGGTIFKATNNLSLGLNIITPRKLEFKKVADFNFDGSLDDLDLEAPLEIGTGAAYTIGNTFLIEADIKWINWSDADGYKDFDWNDQWVFAIGAQYEPIAKLFIRAGYNYGKTPVDDNDGFNGQANKSVQGKTLPTYYYETFRLIGFPALAEHHVTLGLGYEFTPSFSMNLGYMHAFKNSLSEKGTDVTGTDVEIESELTENAIDFGLTWRF
ncbi:MAG: outer membrane protein transport protein [Desulfobacteraceae bacterium]|jgi:long-chain fatty acid transport protein|nr:outer membrane protein transport protein [Desulfobacteraceae bacterium]